MARYCVYANITRDQFGAVCSVNLNLGVTKTIGAIAARTRTTLHNPGLFISVENINGVRGIIVGRTSDRIEAQSQRSAGLECFYLTTEQMNNGDADAIRYGLLLLRVHKALHGESVFHSLDAALREAQKHNAATEREGIVHNRFGLKLEQSLDAYNSMFRGLHLELAHGSGGDFYDGIDCALPNETNFDICNVDLLWSTIEQFGFSRKRPKFFKQGDLRAISLSLDVNEKKNLKIDFVVLSGTSNMYSVKWRGSVCYLTAVTGSPPCV